ncbi:chemotaxis protein CheB [Epilithonimonas arachidiradicis]|uniref:protein-glutamate methylesterase n=2 Tax=Epilithonimonas arachidiradicis TaxID=1617282 RepID=A0ABQ1XBM4_9FLAO|nr:chemotaxis protein CheB [Epilithonimonas arachidiradicis]GGG66345.1 putative chemotaxis protein-glutamate methylesterase [Epilithonimonas arachidiradicis]
MMNGKTELVIIGGSAGSLQVILELVRGLDADLGFAIVLVVHRKAQSTSILPILLQQFSLLEVMEIEDKTEIQANKIYIAPADYHLLFDDKTNVSLDRSEKLHFSRPSIDVSFRSASEVYEGGLVAVLLSGANSDGVEGLQYVKRNGGQVWIQNPETAEIDFMPKQAVDHVYFDLIITPENLPRYINQLNKNNKL